MEIVRPFEPYGGSTLVEQSPLFCGISIKMSDTFTLKEKTMSVTKDIEALLPHRKPFLFVDEIIRADDEGSESRYTFKPAEFFFKGHFPDYPVVPGVVLVETMAQAGGAALSSMGKFENGALFFLATVDKVKLRAQVRPGDTVRIEVKNLRVSSQMIKQSGKIYNGDAVAAEAEWMCLVGKA